MLEMNEYRPLSMNGQRNELHSLQPLYEDRLYNKLTILVWTSFSMALTSSAALDTSEDDCSDVSKDEDLERKKKEEEVVC